MKKILLIIAIFIVIAIAVIYYISLSPVKNLNKNIIEEKYWRVVNVDVVEEPDYNYPEALLKCQYYRFYDEKFHLSSYLTDIEGHYNINDNELYLYMDDTMTFNIEKFSLEELKLTTTIDELTFRYTLHPYDSVPCISEKY